MVLHSAIVSQPLKCFSGYLYLTSELKKGESRCSAINKPVSFSFLFLFFIYLFLFLRIMFLVVYIHHSMHLQIYWVASTVEKTLANLACFVCISQALSPTKGDIRLFEVSLEYTNHHSLWWLQLLLLNLILHAHYVVVLSQSVILSAAAIWDGNLQ